MKQGTECCNFEHRIGNTGRYAVTCESSRTTGASLSWGEAITSGMEREKRVEIYGQTAVRAECSVAISNAAAFEGSFD